MNLSTPAIILGILIVAGLLLLVLFLMIVNYGQLWFQAYWSKSRVTFLELIRSADVVSLHQALNPGAR